MQRFLNVLQQLNLRRVLATFLAGFVLLIATACNNGDARGARPVNPPVQVGGANNPHKMGGDNYTNYQMSDDARAQDKLSNARSDLQLQFPQLIAASTNSAENESLLLYPGSEEISSSKRISELRQQADKVADSEQPILIQTDPEAKLLEKTQQAVNDASGFLQGVTESTQERPELQANPTKH